MGTGYTRQSAAEITDGQPVTALGLENEFDALQSAFHAATGHTHDGTAGEGPMINLTTSITGVLPIANGGFAGKHKLDAIIAPTVNEDSADGYAVGSHWIDVTADVVYTMVDASVGAAVWQRFQLYDADLLSWGAVARAAGFDTFTATPSSANLAALLTDETGTGANVFATSPTLVTPILGTPTSVTLTNATGLPISTGVSGLAAGIATFLGTPSSANLASAVTDETGSGALVFANSPTLVTPALGTPASGVMTNVTGLPVSTGISGLAAGVADFLGSPSSANLLAAVTNETGTGSLVFATSPTLVTPILGTPTSGTLTNATGLPISTGVSGLAANVATFLATPSSANLLAAMTNETGTGSLVFATSPTLVTPILGTPTSGTMTNVTGLPLTTGVTGTLPVANGGTGIASYTAGDIIYASDATTFTKLAKGTASQVLTMNAGATAPEWTTSASGVSAASAAEQETGTEAAKYVAPATQHRHPSAAKFWAKIAGNGTLTSSYNVTSVTDTAVGRATVNIATDFSSADWACIATIQSNIDTTNNFTNQIVIVNSQAAGTCEIACIDLTMSTTDTNTTVAYGDPVIYYVTGFGDHA